MLGRELPTLGSPNPAFCEEVPDWFLLAGWDRCPLGFRPLPLEFVPFRFVEAAQPPDRRLMVIVSGHLEADGKRWVHVSFSRPHKLPSWEDIRRVKDTFIGPERLAIQVFPPEAQYVNIHQTCLHLWHCVDGDPCPDFRHGGQI